MREFLYCVCDFLTLKVRASKGTLAWQPTLSDEDPEQGKGKTHMTARSLHCETVKARFMVRYRLTLFARLR